MALVGRSLARKRRDQCRKTGLFSGFTRTQHGAIREVSIGAAIEGTGASH
jgi:hypothetical protein